MKRLLARGFLLGALGSGTAAVVALLRNILIARVMGPAAFGLWQVCLVALRLGGESHLGALHAVAVKSPILRGAGRDAEADTLERRAFAVALLAAGVAGALAALLLLSEGGSAVLGAAILLVGTMVIQQAFLFDGVVLRTRRRFGRLAALQSVFAVLHLGGLLLLVPSRYLTGALMAWAGAQVAALLLVRFLSRDPLPRPMPCAPPAALAVVRTGFPAWLVGASFLLILQADRIVVGGLMDPVSLGHYGILLLGGSLLLLFPDVVSGVLWPFAGERFGASGEDRSALGSMARGVLRDLAPALAALLLFALQATDVLVARVLPQYAPALEPLRWYLPGVYMLALALPLRHLLVTVGEERHLLRIQGGALVGVLALQCLAVLGGFGLAGVAAASSLAGGVLLALMLRHAHRCLDPERSWLPRFLGVLLLGGAALGADRLLGGLAPPADSLAGAGVRCGIPLVLLAVAGVPVLLGVLGGESATEDNP